MPLKHATETMLVFLLGVVLLLTGVTLRLLPELPAGLLWWAVMFTVSLVYPLSLYPLMRQRRAEYSLRALHFLPAVLLLLWLVASLSMEWVRPLHVLIAFLRWGLGILPVTVGLLLLFLYCLSVIRQRATRLPLLLLLFVPFALLGLSTEWRGWQGGLQAGVQGSSRSMQANLDPSKNLQENRWRGMLRRMERREERIARNDDPFAASSVIAAVQSSSAPIMIAAKTSASSSRPLSSKSFTSASSRSLPRSISSARTVVDAPPSLTSSGPGTAAVGVFLLSGYFTALQRRAMRRKHA